MSHSPVKPQYYNESRTSRHENTDGHRHHHNGDGRGYQNGDHVPHVPHVPRSSYADRTYSLPRTVVQQQQHLQKSHPGYYTQDRRNRSAQHSTQHTASSAGIDQPDFYFMPSQRKYSGEVVRVYVDYNKEPKN